MYRHKILTDFFFCWKRNDVTAAFIFYNRVQTHINTVDTKMLVILQEKETFIVFVGTE